MKTILSLIVLTLLICVGVPAANISTPGGTGNNITLTGTSTIPYAAVVSGTNFDAQLAGVATIIWPEGNTSRFTGTNDVSNGNALISAVNSATNACIIKLSPATFDISAVNTLDLSKGGTASISLIGCGANKTFIRNIAEGGTGEMPAITYGEKSILMDFSLFVDATASNNGYPLGDWVIPGSLTNTAIFADLNLEGGTDVLFNNAPRNLIVDRCNFFTSWDNVVWEGGTLKIFNSTFTENPSALYGNYINSGSIGRALWNDSGAGAGTIYAYDSMFTAVSNSINNYCVYVTSASCTNHFFNCIFKSDNAGAADFAGYLATTTVSTGCMFSQPLPSGIVQDSINITSLVGTMITAPPTNTIVGYFKIATKFGTTNLFIPCVYTNQ